MNKNLGINFFCAAMQISLSRLLSRCGIRFLQVGLPVDYHGLRAAFLAEPKDIEAGIFLKNPNRFITESRAEILRC